MSGRPRGFHAAQLRDTISIETATETISSDGQPTRVWAVSHRSLPAKWEPVAGTETVRGRSVEAGIKTLFTIREISGITAESRVVHSSGTYGIAYVKLINGISRFIELHCKQAVA